MTFSVTFVSVYDFVVFFLFLVTFYDFVISVILSQSAQHFVERFPPCNMELFLGTNRQYLLFYNNI